jgi:hypothetical protein
MLVSEESEMKRAGDGKFYRWFFCEKDVRNEGLDGRVGTMAIERIVKPNYAKLAEEMGGGIPYGADGSGGRGSQDLPTATPPARRFVPLRRGFVSNWRK